MRRAAIPMLTLFAAIDGEIEAISFDASANGVC
jgi:hypothetical protein